MIMASSSSNESEGVIAALLDEGACLLNDMGSPIEQTPPRVAKTPTTPTRTGIESGSCSKWGAVGHSAITVLQPGVTCIICLHG